MSGQNPENFSEGDWEERGDLAWNEHDWQQYLNRNERELTRFVSLYKKLKGQTNCLDEIAVIMGWDQDEWNISLDLSPDASDEKAWDRDDAMFEEDDMDIEDTDPYTVHRHPVCIVTRGLYRYLLQEWERLCLDERLQITPSLAFKLPQSMRDGEYNAIMGIYAVDVGDYNLCVNHLKNALLCMNQSLSLLQKMPKCSGGKDCQYKVFAQSVLFDLRELWLRVMRECREEFRRGYRG
jgi:hypothetical protein